MKTSIARRKIILFFLNFETHEMQRNIIRRKVWKQVKRGEGGVHACWRSPCHGRCGDNVIGCLYNECTYGAV